MTLTKSSTTYYRRPNDDVRGSPHSGRQGGLNGGGETTSGLVQHQQSVHQYETKEIIVDFRKNRPDHNPL